MEEYPHLPEYADSFITHLQNKGRKNSTIKRYYYDLCDFFAWVRVIKKTDDLNMIQQLDAAALIEYFLFLSEQREYKTATSKRVFTVIKSLFHFLHGNRFITYNPFLDLEQTLKEDTHFTEENLFLMTNFKPSFIRCHRMKD